MKIRRAPLAVALAAALAAALPVAARSGTTPPGGGATLPVGFGAGPFVTLPGRLLTSLTWGPDTRGGKAARLYVTTMDGSGGGMLHAVDDAGGVGGAVQVVAGGLRQPLGVAVGPDATVYVSENVAGEGSVRALRDADGDGVAERSEIVARGFPTGRHQTNGLAFGPDGALYVANGSATDDGVECGPEPLDPRACARPEEPPWTGAVLRIDPAWRGVDVAALPPADVVVARGLRNVYDLAFRPAAPSVAYLAMNGPDDPAGDDLLYRVDVDDVDAGGVPRVEDMGFPACLYNPHANPFPGPGTRHSHGGNPEPEDNPNPEVRARFGACEAHRVTRPLLSLGGHVASAGVAFAPHGNFPARYVGDLFVAEWGSLWNVTGGEVTGHKVVQVHLTPDGRVAWSRDFMTGVTPIDVAFGPDGAMYVADFSGTVQRVVSLADTPGTVRVAMRNGQFVPATVVVPRGTTVEWVNEDTVPHNVRGQLAAFEQAPFVRSGADADADLAPGQSHTFRFDSGSVWKYRSTTTSTDAATMHGTVVVAPADR